MSATHPSTGRGACLLLLALVAATTGAFLVAHPSDAPRFSAFCPGGAEVVVTGSTGDCLRFTTVAWGPNWAWTGVNGQTESRDGAAAGRFAATVGGVPLRLDFRASRPAPNRMELTYELSSEKDAS
ncbi:MAG: hypothetical protein H7A46_00250 [Verrucomicrobiales bacterium]|nr:hypothetical protein [Verrucomicrobiales bacterium]